MSRAPHRRGGVFVVAFFAAHLVLGYALWKRQGPLPVAVPCAAVSLELQSDKETYFHDEFVELTLRPASEEVRVALRRSTAPLTAWVEHGGRPVLTVGDWETIPLAFAKDARVWRARWPVPWNAVEGTYALRLTTASLPTGIGEIHTGSFRIDSRKFEAVPPGFGVLTLEGLGSLARFSGPHGEAPQVGAMAEWADFMGADAVLIQGAESSGYRAKLGGAFPWQMRSVEPVAALAEACHRRGLRLGVYVLSYMVGGPPAFSPDYAYGWHYQSGRAVYGLDLPVRRGVSIAEPKRPGDIVEVLNRWASVEGVDFLGLDYIRPVFGGNELVDDFLREMPQVEKPQGYDDWTSQQRLGWMARNRFIAPTAALRKESKFRTTDQWFWYRAHRTAGVVRKIVEGLGEKKPLWAFTLSWQKGWEHGQDPAMMRDAGIDINGIMLYEADGDQFRGLLSQWNAYTRAAPFNLVVGDTFDWRLHQKTLRPAGPEEMARRTLAAVERFQEGRPVRGIFMHDWARALRGNLGPYPPKEWFLAAGGALTRLREIHGCTPYRIALSLPDRARPGEPLAGAVVLDSPVSGGPVSVELFSSSDLSLSVSQLELTPTTSSATFVARWQPNEPSVSRGDRAFVALRSFRPDRPKERCQIHTLYVQGDRSAPPLPAAEGF